MAPGIAQGTLIRLGLHHPCSLPMTSVNPEFRRYFGRNWRPTTPAPRQKMPAPISVYRRCRNEPGDRPKLAVPLSISIPPWPGGPCLELIHEFNEHFVEQVAEVARENGERTMPEMVRMHRDLWVSLDGPARRRASQCPFLLADIQFRNAGWWQRAQTDLNWRGGPPSSARLFLRKPAIDLTRDALIVAWYTARQDVRLAATFLAMSDEVAHIVAKLGMRQLWHVADHYHQHLRPRWEHLGSFWGRLLSAANRDDLEALYDLHLQAFQLSDADSGFVPSGPDSAAGVHDR